MRTRALVLCVAAMTVAVGVQPATAAVGSAPSAAAVQGSPCDQVLAGESNTTAGPGRELADAIGAQGDEIGTVLDDRAFEARLANATSSTERAAVVAEEVDRLEAYLTALEDCWREIRSDDDPDAAAETSRRDPVAVLERRAVTVQQRLNETGDEAATLPADLRRERDVDRRRMAALERRALDLRASLSGDGDGEEGERGAERQRDRW